MKIEFEDNGQDFLTWTLDNEGFVVQCEPFQGRIWCGCQVMEADHLQPGDQVDFIDKCGEPRTLNHRVEAIILEGE